uniref:Uncharacterized protein C1orf21 homolog isoform X1 n=1 Tax=Geotrypetes seraphini TaxID=260995 RepID=A0A6P8NSX4_GEOSA|nr:uncharacterized protein C1orf21 homolog isoform X1 [Geotrypetes seraphini]
MIREGTDMKSGTAGPRRSDQVQQQQTRVGRETKGSRAVRSGKPVSASTVTGQRGTGIQGQQHQQHENRPGRETKGGRGSKGGSSRKQAVMDQEVSSTSTGSGGGSSSSKDSKEKSATSQLKAKTNKGLPGMAPQPKSTIHISDSQQEFFRMLDEKIEKGHDYYSEEDIT